MRWLARLLSGKLGGAKPGAPLRGPSAQAKPGAGAEALRAAPPAAPEAESGLKPGAAPEAASSSVQASFREAGPSFAPSGVLLKRPPRSYEDRIRPVAFRTDPLPLVAAPKRLFQNERTPCLPWEADRSGRVALGGDGALREAERRVQERFSGVAPAQPGGDPLTDDEVCWSAEDEASELQSQAKPVRSGQLLFPFAESDPEPGFPPKATRQAR